MVELSIKGDMLVLNVKGLHKLLAFTNSLQVPLAAIKSVEADPEGYVLPEGIRSLGTHIPGLIAAGSFHSGLKRVFWDVHNAKNAIVITMKSGEPDILMLLQDRYDELVVEVEDPEEAVRFIEERMVR